MSTRVIGMSRSSVRDGGDRGKRQVTLLLVMFFQLQRTAAARGGQDQPPDTPSVTNAGSRYRYVAIGMTSASCEPAIPSVAKQSRDPGAR